jgi:hypothetical protein
MIRLASKAMLLSALGVMAAGAVLAGVPNATNSNLNAQVFGVPGPILILGGRSGGGVADPRCEKQITVKDAANNPVANSVVTINFANCDNGADNIRLANTQPFNTLNCAAQSVSATTNASGVAVFRIVGAAFAAGSGTAGVGEGCATVTADGVPLGALSVATADLSGNLAGVGNNDFLMASQAIFNAALCAPCYRSRINYVGAVGTYDNADFTYFSQTFSILGSSSNAAAFCP